MLLHPIRSSARKRIDRLEPTKILPLRNFFAIFVVVGAVFPRNARRGHASAQGSV